MVSVAKLPIELRDICAVHAGVLGRDLFVSTVKAGQFPQVQ